MKNRFSVDEIRVLTDIKINLFKMLFICFVFIIGFIILCKFNFKVYYSNYLIKDNNDYLIVSDINSKNIIEDNKYIFIDNKKYKYEILDYIDYSINNNVIYETVKVKVNNYNSKSKINNFIILKSNDTLIDYFIKFIKGGHHE